MATLDIHFLGAAVQEDQQSRAREELGSVALQENEPAREMFLVSSGTVQVRAGADTLAFVSFTFLLSSEAFAWRHEDAGGAIAANVHPVTYAGV